MKTRLSATFPYTADDPVVFAKLRDLLVAALSPEHRLHTDRESNPLLVVSKVCIYYRHSFGNFKNGCPGVSALIDEGKNEVMPVWAVDTCQMWLAAFGKIIDDVSNVNH